MLCGSEAVRFVSIRGVQNSSLQLHVGKRHAGEQPCFGPSSAAIAAETSKTNGVRNSGSFIPRLFRIGFGRGFGVTVHRLPMVHTRLVWIVAFRSAKVAFLSRSERRLSQPGNAYEFGSHWRATAEIAGGCYGGSITSRYATLSHNATICRADLSPVSRPEAKELTVSREPFVGKRLIAGDELRKSALGLSFFSSSRAFAIAKRE